MSDDPRDLVAMHRAHWPETFDARLMPFVVALHRARDQHMKRSEAVSARYGLSPAELDVLITLRRSPPPWVLTPSELKRCVFITSGGLAKILQQLAAKGLVARLTDSGDRRVKPVQLTEAGQPIVAAALDEIVARTSAWVGARLSDDEIDQATAILTKLVGTGGGSGDHICLAR